MSTETLDQSFVADILTAQMGDLVQAILNGTVEIVRGEDGEPCGVRWPYEDCWDSYVVGKCAEDV